MMMMMMTIRVTSRYQEGEADKAQGIGGVDYPITGEADSKDLIDEVGI